MNRISNRPFGALLLATLAVAAFTGCGKDNPDSVKLSDSSGKWTDSTDDLISNTSFDRTVRVVFASGGALVTGEGSTQSVKISGNDVTITNSGQEVVRYELSGSTSDGFFKLYSDRKQAIVLDGVSITNPGGAAINNQSKKRTFVVLSGSSSLQDGSLNSSGNYADQTSSEDMKAAFFSEGQLIFSGSGSLSVTAVGKAGITSDDYVRVMSGPAVSVSTSAGHGVRGKDYVVLSGGTLDINVSASATGKKGISTDGTVYISGGTTTITSKAAAGTVDGELTGAAGVKADVRFEMTGGSLCVTCSGTGAKGIKCDNVGYVSGGTIDVSVNGSNYGTSSSRPGYSSSSSNSKAAKGIKCDGNLYISGGTINSMSASHEGIESKGKIEISSGIVYAYASDDAINSDGDMTITGGSICAWSSGNDGLDANGNLYIKGGSVYAVGSNSPEVAIDANTEQGKKFTFTGGTLVAIGGIENGSTLSQTCYSASQTRSQWYALYSGSTVALVFKTPASVSSSNGSGMVVSTAGTTSLKVGVTTSGGTSIWGGYGLAGATVTGGTDVSLGSYTSSSGGMGPGTGGMGPGW